MNDATHVAGNALAEFLVAAQAHVQQRTEADALARKQHDESIAALQVEVDRLTAEKVALETKNATLVVELQSSKSGGDRFVRAAETLAAVLNCSFANDSPGVSHRSAVAEAFLLSRGWMPWAGRLKFYKPSAGDAPGNARSVDAAFNSELAHDFGVGSSLLAETCDRIAIRDARSEEDRQNRLNSSPSKLLKV